MLSSKAHRGNEQGTSSIPIRSRSRRSSILDAGGEESINNFASSVKRSVNFLSTSYDGTKGDFHVGSSSPLSRVDAIHNLSFRNPIIQTQGEANILNPDVTLATNYQSISNTNVLSPVVSNESYNNAAEIILDDETHDVLKIVARKSTPTQTVFNSINVLIGLGVFSIPLALHLSGWVLGILLLTFAASAAALSAILLGRIMREYPHLRTYQDIGIFTFGDSIGIFILIIFSLDLLGAGISMIILFADSFNILFPGMTEFSFKLIIVSLLFVLNFMPLRLLSFLSLVGIICTSTTCVIIFVSGLIKGERPGSLNDLMPTNLWPLSTTDLLFSLGLYLAPWGGHATFPEIYGDQALPEKFNDCMGVSFSFAYAVDLLTGVFGFLMFGKLIEDEVTKSILKTKGFPGLISTLVVILMGLLPISKLPLISRPIITALDSFNNAAGSTVKTVFNRLMLSCVYLFISLLLTNFATVMSLLGSAICFVVCITLPVSYYLVIFKDRMTVLERLSWWAIIIVSVLGAILGTAAVFIEKS